MRVGILGSPRHDKESTRQSTVGLWSEAVQIEATKLHQLSQMAFGWKSNHTATVKPSRKIFEKALQRLGMPATSLKHCCFITENAAHIKAAREQLHMQTFQFGVDFTDWAEVPAMFGVASPSVGSRGWHMILGKFILKMGRKSFTGTPHDNNEYRFAFRN